MFLPDDSFDIIDEQIPIRKLLLEIVLELVLDGMME